MVRVILAVIVGYVALFLFIFVTFSVAYLTMGADAAFRPGTYEPSNLWLVISFVLGFIAAIIGGCVAATIARGGKAPLVLAGLAFVLAIAFAIPVLMANTEPSVRDSSVPNMDAMWRAAQPAWVVLLQPFLTVGGILLGARLQRRRSAGAASV